MTTVARVGPSPNGGGPRPSLTERELDVLTRMANGATYEAVARAYGFSDRTASWIGQCIMRKLGANSIAQAVYEACRTGILDVSEAQPRPGEVLAYASLRLLRSLLAEGFSVSFISHEMGMRQSDLSALMQRTRITTEKAALVRDVFARLAGRDPLALGVHKRGYTRAKNRASWHRWEIVPAVETERIRRTVQHAA